MDYIIDAEKLLKAEVLILFLKKTNGNRRRFATLRNKDEKWGCQAAPAALRICDGLKEPQMCHPSSK